MPTFIFSTLRLLPLCLLAIGLVPAAMAATYYVSAAGNDANDGLASTRPWKTVAKVNAAVFAPGDRILFARGSEWRESLIASSHGAAGNPIVYDAYGSGAKPKFWGSEVLDNSRFEPYRGNVYLYRTTKQANCVLANSSWFFQTDTISINDWHNSFTWTGFGLLVNTAGIDPRTDGRKYNTCLREDVIYTNYKHNLVFRNLVASETAQIDGGYAFRVMGSDNVLLEDCEAYYAGRHHFGVINSNGFVGRRLHAAYAMPHTSSTFYVSYSDRAQGRSNDTSQWIDCSGDHFENPGRPNYAIFYNHGDALGAILVENMTSDGGAFTIGQDTPNNKVTVKGGLLKNNWLEMFSSGSLIDGLTVQGEAAGVDVFGSDNMLQNLLVTGINPRGGGRTNYHTAILMRPNAKRNTLRFSTVVMDPTTQYGTPLALADKALQTSWYGNIFVTPQKAVQVWIGPIEPIDAAYADYNLYSPGSIFNDKTLAEWQQMGRDQNSLSANPQFKNQAGGIYSLASGSPALNRMPSLPASAPLLLTDLAGTQRPQGGRYELGAFEESATAAAPVILTSSAASTTVGQSFQLQIQATGNPTQYAATGLPTGITLNTTSGLLSGAPTQAGTYNVAVSATNSIGSGSKTIQLVVQDELVAHWRFDETGGTMANNSAGSGSATLRNNARFSAGKIGNGLTLDGTGAYADSSIVLTPLEQFTIAFWMRTEAPNDLYTVLSKPYGSALDNSFVVFGRNGQLNFHSTNSSGFMTTGPVSGGVWHHVVVSKSGTNGKMYVDGVEAASTNSLPAVVQMDGRPLLFGAEDDSGDGTPESYYFKGQIDDVKILRRAATPQELGQTPPPDPDPEPTDTTNPIVAVTSPAEGTSVSGSVTLAATASDNVGVVGVQFRLNGSNLGAEDTTAPYSTIWNTATAPAGTHALTAVARDAAGNRKTSVAINVTIPALPPPPDDTAPAGHWRLDETSGNRATDSSSNGNHATLQGAALWTAGKIGNALQFDGTSHALQVTDSPTLRGSTFSIAFWMKSSNVSGNRAMISKPVGTGSDNSFVVYTQEGQLRFHSCCSSGSVAFGSVSANQWYHVSVVKQGTIARLYINGAQTGIHNNVPATVNYDSHPMLIGAEDDNGDTTLEYRYAGLLDDVRFYQRALTVAEVAELAQTTPAPDTTAPSTPGNITATVNGTSVQLNWNPSSDSVGVTGYRIYRGGTQIATSTTTSYTDTGLTAGTTYQYSLAAFDAAGNLSSRSGNRSVTVPTVTDRTAPSVPAGLSAVLNGRSVQLTWSASTDSVGVTGYRIYRGGAQIATTAAASYTDSGLAAGATYQYAVAAYDAAGNLSARSGTTSISVPAADTAAPSRPASLRLVSKTAVQVSIAWNASTDNTGVAGYRIFRNGTQIGTATALTFTSTELTPSTTYSFTVLAYDAAGNVSAISSTLSVTTERAASDTSLVAHWRLDEGSGSLLNDASSYNNDATLVGTPAWQAGRISQAANFDGATQHAIAPASASLNVTRITVSAWVYKRTDQSSWGLITHRALGSSWEDLWGLYYNNSGVDEYSFVVRTSQNTVATIVGPASVGDYAKWVHLVGTYDGSTVCLYKDGVLVGSAPLSGDIPAQTNPVSLAAGTNDAGRTYSERFNGAIDDVRIHNRALSAAEVQALYQAAPPLSTTTAKRIMPLGDSLTFGTYGNGDATQGGYRKDLWSKLQTQATPVDFVGGVSTPTAGLDPNHEGHPGKRLDHIAEYAAGWVSAAQPDLVLLLLGTNDLLQNATDTVALSRLDVLLDRIHTARAESHVIVASLPTVRVSNSFNLSRSKIQAFNAGVPGLVSNKAAQGRKVSFVDLHNLAPLADSDFCADGLHPVASGYSKMATVWYDALVSRL